MSEEKPTFKITDRRLFNADGSPRDVEREEETTIPEAAEVVAAPAAGVEGARAPQSQTGAAPAAGGAAPPISSAPPEVFPGAAESAAGELSEADDAAEGSMESSGFVNLVMFIASPAAAALGMTEHPEMAGHGIDLPFAKHCIDLLGALREKTRTNLSAQEQQFLDGLLSELRMQFVSLNTTRPAAAPAGGFTGSDITGGR